MPLPYIPHSITLFPYSFQKFGSLIISVKSEMCAPGVRRRRRSAAAVCCAQKPRVRPQCLRHRRILPDIVNFAVSASDHCATHCRCAATTASHSCCDNGVALLFHGKSQRAGNSYARGGPRRKILYPAQRDG